MNPAQDKPRHAAQPEPPRAPKSLEEYCRNAIEMENAVVQAHSMALLADVAFGEAEDNACAATFHARRYTVLSVADWSLMKTAIERLIADVKRLEAVYYGPDLATGDRPSEEVRIEDRTKLFRTLNPDWRAPS